MRYLLIDFGASFIKTASYDDELDLIENYEEISSPFISANILSLRELQNILINILDKNTDCEYVVSSSIKNGTYIEDIYYSWKEKIQDRNISDPISKIFSKQDTYHIHNDHDSKSLHYGLKILGIFHNKIFLSCLGDTDCVKRSKKLSENEAIINLGTGSQIIFCDNIISFIPSGRMFNIFYNFFQPLGLNIFDSFSKLSVEDLNKSSLEFDLSVFPQAINFIDFGKITNIQETNFNIDNFISSLMRNYLRQYENIIKEKNLYKVYLMGGISQKLPIVKSYFEKQFPNIEFIIDKECSVHLGMVDIIKNEKNLNNWV